MVRLHLRHTGMRKLKFGVSKMSFGHGWNLTFGRWFLACRYDYSPRPYQFFDLGFGRDMLRASKNKTKKYYYPEVVDE